LKNQTRIVLDTNILVSGVLFPNSAMRQTIVKARAEGLLLASEATLLELQTVLQRSQFDRTVERSLRDALFREYAHCCKIVPVLSTIRAWRDPKDDTFLELAFDGRATQLITVDQDLLSMHPFRSISILTPAEYLSSPPNEP
jgi:putative PIN family toxin of toxin-antitoxin system